MAFTKVPLIQYQNLCQYSPCNSTASRHISFSVGICKAARAAIRYNFYMAGVAILSVYTDIPLGKLNTRSLLLLNAKTLLLKELTLYRSRRKSNSPK